MLSSLVIFILVKSFRVVFLDLNFKLRNSGKESFDKGYNSFFLDELDDPNQVVGAYKGTNKVK